MRRLWLLLLVASCIHVIESGKEKDERRKKELDNLMEKLSEVRLVLRPFFSLIPVWGPMVSAIIDLPLGVASIMYSLGKTSVGKQMENHFQDLKHNLEGKHAQVLLASDTFRPIKQEIEAASVRYELYRKSFAKEKNNVEKENLKNGFLEYYKNHEDVIDKLANRLNDQTFQKLLAKAFDCHDNELVDFTVNANYLLGLASAMKLDYLRIKDKNPELKMLPNFDSKLIYSSFKSLFVVRTECLANIEDNVKNDVQKMMTAEVKKGLKDSRQKVANDIHAALAKAYPVFNWLVVIYKSGDARSPRKCITNVELSIKVDDFIVGVEWVLKGSHTEGPILGKAIVDCLDRNKIECDKVEEKLTSCNNAVGDRKLSDYICAIHIYKGDRSLSVDGLPTTSTKTDSNMPAFYEGKCKHNLLTFKFVVTLKSKEQASQKDDCDGRDCGHGTCKLVKQVGICECQDEYYGEKCENSIKEGQTSHSQSSSRSSSRSPIRRSSITG